MFFIHFKNHLFLYYPSGALLQSVPSINEKSHYAYISKPRFLTIKNLMKLEIDPEKKDCSTIFVQLKVKKTITPCFTKYYGF
jgi:hypothetical protein